MLDGSKIILKLLKASKTDEASKNFLILPDVIKKQYKVAQRLQRWLIFDKNVKPTKNKLFQSRKEFLLFYLTCNDCDINFQSVQKGLKRN